MRLFLTLALLLVAAAPAGAATITVGSDLSSEATMVESQGADTAFWAAELPSGAVTAPEDGQVVAVRVRGSALREKNASNDPATMVHFQSLDPAGANGARQVYLTSAAFFMPVDDPSAVSTFKPENLCIRQGGAVAFNTIGGHKWGGSLDAPTVEGQYLQGTPWQIFARTSTASTAWFSKDDGTKNGDTLTPAGGHDAAGGHGGILQGTELLMQVVLATGDDRSEACGGPRRHADGTLVDTSPPPSYMKVASVGGKPQRPYVSRNRRFTVGVFCGGPTVCVGRAIVVYKKRRIARRKFSIESMMTGRIGMRLTRRHFRKLDRAGKLRVRYVLKPAFGTYRTKLVLKR